VAAVKESDRPARHWRATTDFTGLKVELEERERKWTQAARKGETTKGREKEVSCLTDETPMAKELSRHSAPMLLAPLKERDQVLLLNWIGGNEEERTLNAKGGEVNLYSKLKLRNRSSRSLCPDDAAALVGLWVALDRYWVEVDVTLASLDEIASPLSETTKSSTKSPRDQKGKKKNQ